ncbi:PH domain-containing protein [Rothia nasimurium]|uniref:PH domain-containing protein n=1 Tax=Rothia nasimurium TaxID=85336 RepID=UPI003BA1F09E
MVLVTLAVSGGVGALVTRGWGVVFLGYAVWYVLGRPHVVVDRHDVRVVNPFVTHTVNYAALIDISTRYHLTLVTPTRGYQAFGIPAGGMVASLNAHKQDLKNLPSITFGEGGSMRTSDLPNSSAGAAALVLRGYWQELVEDGALDQVQPVQISRVDVRGSVVFAVLLVAAVAGLMV